MNNTTKLTPRDLLDDRNILSVVMEQQEKRKSRKFVPSTPLNPVIFPTPKQIKSNTLLDLPEYYINSAVIDSAFTEVNKNPYDNGVRVPSHQQVRINEQNKNIGLILNKQYKPQKIVATDELGSYSNLDDIITTPMEITPLRPKVIKPEPIPVRPERVSYARGHSTEEVDIKKEFIEFRNKIKDQDVLNEEKIKTTYKYPLKQLKKRDPLLEHLSQIMEE